MTLAILIFGLVVATCFIAYIADNIGKNLGKKRVSIFGLRPRQTATLISMASSVAVMLLTVGILMVTSASLRNALLRYDAEKKEANQQRREKEKLLKENQGLLLGLNEQRALIKNQLTEIELNRRRAEQFSQQRQRVEEQLKGASGRLAAARKGEASARARAQAAQSRLAVARRQFETFKAQLATARMQVEQARARVENAQGQVRQAQAELRTEQVQVAAVRTRLNEAQQRLITAQERLRSAQERQQLESTRLAQARTQLTAARTNFERVEAEVKLNLKQLEKAETDIAALETRRNQLQADLDTQQKELAQLKIQTDQYKTIVTRIGTGDVATPQGEVFADKVVPATVSSGQARSILSELMAEARGELNDPPRTLNLDLPPNATNLSEDEFLNGFAAYLSTLRVPVSVRLAAARDHARGETEISAQLVPIVVRRVFEEGEVLASAAIEQEGGDARIFNQLLTLLNQAERRARDRGVTPLLTPQNPLFYPAGTNERVFEALRKIQDLGAAAEVRLIAASDITTVDSPRVLFEVEKTS